MAGAVLSAIPAFAQSAMDGFRFCPTDIKGTARFMSMGGAFGALGADLTTLSYNPAGIGVYRASDIGVTVNLDCQNAAATSMDNKSTLSQTKFLLNNIGGVATIRLNSSVVPNFNIGFTYNKAASFNGSVRGSIPQLRNSITNYIAGVSNHYDVTVGDVEFNQHTGYDPYNPNDGGLAAPWISILGYDSYFVTPEGDPDYPNWQGQWREGTSGNGAFTETVTGSINEYNIAFGGNFANLVYWGMDFGIIGLDYNLSTVWGERMTGAYVDTGGGVAGRMDSNIALSNYYGVSGNGFNYKLGVIVKPIQELRFGFAFHTPTWYSIEENYSAETTFTYDNANRHTRSNTPMGYNEYNLRTPWRFIASIAGVVGHRIILSADYDWQSYNHMHFSPYSSYSYGGDWDWWDDPWDWYAPAQQQTATATRAGEPFVNDPFAETNADVKEYYQTSSTLRVGAEYRVTPRFSVRAGYAYTSSPVRSKAKSGEETIYTSGTLTSYTFDDNINYITCGLGYNFKSFYTDLAYVWKHRTGTWHAYTPDPTNPGLEPSAKVGYTNNQIVLSMGFKF